MSSTEPKLITQEARYLLYVNRMILPVEFRELSAALAKNGFELAIIRNLPPPPNRIIYSGEIGRKKETIVVADSEAGEIGVVSKSLAESSTSFNDLIKIINDEIGVNLYEHVKFFEIVAHYKLDTGKIPLKEIPKAENKQFIAKFSEIIGQSLSTYSIRLSKKDSSINQNDWIDIAIEPDMVYENNYHIGVIFRDLDKSKTETFVKNLESNLVKMVKTIEA